LLAISTGGSPLLRSAKGDPPMNHENPKRTTPSKAPIQKNLFNESFNETANKFISIYRVSLVKDGRVSFGESRLHNAPQAQDILRKLIEKKGQSDREQFCIILLNARNEIIGMNIVATGTLTSTTVHPREVFKPAIIANAAAMILCHNHPSGDPSPSPEDFNLTKMIIQTSKMIGIQVHEHLIINMEDERYYSFADNGHIKRFYDEVG
jgi:DNA repair protein RadC